jgi:hypothetical protein
MVAARRRWWAEAGGACERVDPASDPAKHAAREEPVDLPRGEPEAVEVGGGDEAEL